MSTYYSKTDRHRLQLPEPRPLSRPGGGMVRKGLAALLLGLGLLGQGSVHAQTVKVNSIASCPLPGYIEHSRFLPGTSNIFFSDMTTDPSANSYAMALVSNGTYLNVTVPSGSVYGIPLITKIAPDGTILWNKYAFPVGSYNGATNYPDLLGEENGYLYVGGTVPSISATPGITGPLASYTGSGYAVSQIDEATGNVVKVFGIRKSVNSFGAYPIIKNGHLYFYYHTTDVTLPVTDASSGNASSGCIYVGHLDANGNLVYGEYKSNMDVTPDQESAMAYADGSFMFPATLSGTTVMVKLSSSGSQLFTSVIDPTPSPTFAPMLGFDDAGNSFDVTDHAGVFGLNKLDASGNAAFSVTLPIPATDVVNDAVFLRVLANQPYVSYSTATAFTLMKIDNLSGVVQWKSSIQIGIPAPQGKMEGDNAGNIWANLYVGNSNVTSVTTDGSIPPATGARQQLVGFNPAGDIVYSSIRKNFYYVPTMYKSVNGKLYWAASTSDVSFPVTDHSVKGGASITENLTWNSLSFAPDLSSITSTISPSSTATCSGGATAMLQGNALDLGSSPDVPVLYMNGVATAQKGLKYQWQYSTDGGATWNNIAGATAQNYLPTGLTATTSFRRLLVQGANCSTPLSTSNVATVTVNPQLAPTVTATTPNGYITCPGSPVGIGLNISGGTPPYTTIWNNTNNTLTGIAGTATANPTATSTVSQSTVYTAQVTDANGCLQYGQANVMAYNPGPNTTVSQCGTDSVLIGNAPMAAGLSGVSYAWTAVAPATATFACATCPQTKVIGVGKYRLLQTITKADLSTCTASDTVTVTTMAPPLATAPNGFAGPDFMVCSPVNSSTKYTQIGRSATPGSAFTYTWAPGSYLTSTNVYNPYFMSGSAMPANNPMTYYLTATQSGCTFIDSMKLTVLRADAGIDGCGPRTVGNPTDLMPGVTGKTYAWTRLDNGAGAAAFTGTTNGITAQVSSGSIDTRFMVSVTAPGVGSCTDTVVVTAGCVCVNSRIDVLGTAGCPIYNGVIPVQMQVVTPGILSSAVTYDWTPHAGLNRYDSSVVTLTDGVNRTYTVTLRDKNTNEVLCTVSREVNGPAWSFPAFSATDTITCAPATGTKIISLGQPAVAGYSYAWTGNGISNNTVSNPTITLNSTSASDQYTVVVTDNGSGCTTHDTANVTIYATVANAGPDLLVCGSATFALANGIDSFSNYKYAWTPSTTWLGGSDSTWLHAETAIGADVQFVLRATNMQTGCPALDTVQIRTMNLAPVTISGATTVCKGNPSVLSVPAYGNVTYTWTSSNPAETMPATATGLSSIVVTPQANATYSVSIASTDLSVSCAAMTGSLAVTVKDFGYTPVSYTNYCPSSGTAGLILGPSAAPTTGTAPYTYSWYPATAVANPTQQNTVPSSAPGVTTSYMLTITDATGCAISTTETVQVAAGSKPEAGADRSMCLGGSEILGDPANTNVTWSAVAPASTAQLSSTTAASPVYTPIAAGTFKYAVRYNTGCVNPDTVTLTVRNNPSLTATGATLCSGSGSVATIGTTAATGITYQWSPATGLDNPNASRTVIHANAAMSSYTLLATDSNGCQASVNVPITLSSPAPLVTVPALTLCQSGTPMTFQTAINGTPAVNGSVQYAASWTPPTLLNSATLLQPTVLPGDTGTYNYAVNITDQSTGCNTQAAAQASVIICSTPLPVKLLAFTAEPQEGRISLLNWSTATETDVVQFQVESSADSRNWNNIGTVTAHGNNSDYRFVDEHPLADVVYYRLKVQNIDGSADYSPIRQVRFGSVQAAAGSATVTVYPNPTTGRISVKASATMDRLQLLDLTGQLLLEQRNVTDGSIIELPGNMASGVYMLNCYINGQVRNIKLVLNR